MTASFPTYCRLYILIKSTSLSLANHADCPIVQHTMSLTGCLIQFRRNVLELNSEPKFASQNLRQIIVLHHFHNFKFSYCKLSSCDACSQYDGRLITYPQSLYETIFLLNNISRHILLQEPDSVFNPNRAVSDVVSAREIFVIS